MGLCCTKDFSGNRRALTSCSTLQDTPNVKDVDVFNIEDTRSLFQIRRGFTITFEIRENLPSEFERACTTLKFESECLSMVTQASVDPEAFSLAQAINQILDPTIRRAVTKKFKNESKAITKKHGIYFCKSYSLYHRKRDELIAPYEVHIESYNTQWKTNAAAVVQMIKLLSCAKEWKVEHIGSTAVPGLCAKPVLDIMITIPSVNGFAKAVDDFLREQKNLELDIRIGFKSKAPGSNDDWGFFQVPKNINAVGGINEVNIHLLADKTLNAQEKRVFRDYLCSSEGVELRDEYGKVKMELMKKLERNEFSVSEYAKQKNDIVAKILKAGFKWGGIGYWPPSTTSRNSVNVICQNMNQQHMNKSKDIVLPAITLGTLNSSSPRISSSMLDASTFQLLSPASGDLHHQFSGICMPQELNKSMS